MDYYIFLSERGDTVNIMTQVCGIIIILTLIVFYATQKKLYLRTEKSFAAMLVTTLVMNILDILSLVGIKYMGELPEIVTVFLCKIYLLAIIVIGSSELLYVTKDIFSNTAEYNKKMLPYKIFIVAGSVAMLILPIDIYSEGMIMYTYGAAANVTYVLSFVSIIFSIILTIVHREEMNSDRRTAVLIWMALWITAALVQLFNPELLLVSFASSVGMMILYIKLENPGMTINKQSGLFNHSSMTEYIQQHFDVKKSFALSSFHIDPDANEMRGCKFNWETVYEQLNTKNALIFRKSEDEGVLIFENDAFAVSWEDSFFEKIKNKDDDNSTCFRHALWTSIYDSMAFADANELISFLKYAEYKKADNIDQRLHIIANKENISNMRREKDMERLINDALKNNTVEVFYQPIFSTEKKKFTSAEALVRLRDESGKIVPPGMFIPIAERTGKILELGNAVFENVCRFINEKQPQKLGIDYIEINLSVVQCSDEKLAENCIAMMKKYNISSDMLNLEITESAELRRKDIFMDNLSKLKSYGISFSLDDFGTGQSNLNYIVDMPIDIVKFDRGMTNAFFTDKKARYVMEAAMQMIHGMGLKIVSEGIETKEQYEKISEMGIAYIQGYYFSKPIPANEFYEFVSKMNA
ncbi:MAG: EAL domain-containing protein [Ruminococcus sp.]|nr:EAL domain-containing protein [Ruminococcus sp.]